MVTMAAQVFRLQGGYENTGFCRGACPQGRSWAVKISAGTRPGDLPDWFAPIFGAKIAGSFEPLRFRNGRFFAVKWVKDASDPREYRAVETEVHNGDWLEMLPCGGVAHLLGQRQIEAGAEEW